MMYGLSDRTLTAIDSVFQKYSGVKQAVIYGSRAKGKFKLGSDIDWKAGVSPPI
jgi:type I restriction enzyme S subunit